ncbi:hypothetical protein [Parafrankia sp. EUN1f]|uniref:hypothetical protein n=1 Tax=Parafrankia sp. EUN1f TaxID=102897 RepID=UPI0001C477AF|nr:hypothetical protein [Parafrankia sp. EUN1f]EFC86842.1 hypothetical protein FrEUN1fDRAFT_0093 [Parafrankia sp. EUN1f]
MTQIERSPQEDLPRRSLLSVVVGSIVCGIIVTGAVGYFGWTFLERLDSNNNVDSTEALELAKFALTVTAGLGAVIALVVAYRRQRVDEAAHHLSAMAGHRDQIRLLSERFSTASTLLGNQEAAATRLAGVYAMATLADEWEDQRQSCVDVLCAYLRLPYSLTDLDRAERQVRFAVYSVIRSHLSPESPISWRNLSFDLSDANLCDGSLAGIEITEGSLSLANSIVSKPGFSLDGAEFRNATVDLSGLRVESGKLSFTGTIFIDSIVNAYASSVLSDGVIDFGNANIFGRSALKFEKMSLNGGWLNFDRTSILWDRTARMPPHESSISFKDSKFDGGLCTFRNMEVESSRIGIHSDRRPSPIDFSSTRSTNSIVSFSKATLPDGRINLGSMRIDGGKLSFERMRVGDGLIDLSGAVLSDGWISFDDAKFSTSGDADDNLIIPTWLRNLDGKTNEERRTVRYLSLDHPPSFLDFSGATLDGGNITFEGMDATYGKIDFVDCRLTATAIWVATWSIGSAVWDFWLSEFSGGLFVFALPSNMVFLIDADQVSGRPFAVIERRFHHGSEDELRMVGSLEEISRHVYGISVSE